MEVKNTKLFLNAKLPIRAVSSNKCYPCLGVSLLQWRFSHQQLLTLTQSLLGAYEVFLCWKLEIGGHVLCPARNGSAKKSKMHEKVDRTFIATESIPKINIQCLFICLHFYQLHRKLTQKTNEIQTNGSS